MNDLMKGYVTLIGMSIAYVASFIGLGLAWYGWKKRHGPGGGATGSGGAGENAGGSTRPGTTAGSAS